MSYFSNVNTKVPDMRTYQNEHNKLLNFRDQTSKTDNNALDNV
jgi:hypothetical protein